MTAATPALAARPSATVRLGRFITRNVLFVYTAFAILYLMLPVAVMALFSFNDPPGKSNVAWHAFSLDAWLNPFGVPGLFDVVRTSVAIAFLSTIIATGLGTLIALALVRYRFRGSGAMNTLIFLPMATPEIVLGASLLTLFLQSHYATGFATIFIAHVMFIISYVVVTVKARLVGFDRHLEEAAMDLGATELTTFVKVTLPLMAPAILSAALLGFAISIDDFVITYFNSGSETTFPLFVWGAARVAVPPQINVVASAIFVVAIVAMIANIVWQRRSARRTQGAA
jgi:spermidine/putrescine transport system permease protein